MDGKITDRTFANLDKKKSERTVMIRAVENRIRKTGNPVGIRDSHLYCNADEKADPLAVCREVALEEDAKSGYPLRSIFGMKK